MKKFFLGVVLAGLVLGGCAPAKQTNVKDANVTITGVIQTKSADEYLLSTNEGIVNLTSNKVNLDNYMKKKVTVTGMYSGDILYVDKIEDKK